MSEEKRKINPLIAAASVAVILFSAVGVGVMTGIIPSSKSSSDELSKTAPKTAAAPEATRAPAAHKPPSEPRPAKTHVAANEPAAKPAAARVCTECGVIDAINVQDHKGAGTGIGAVGGAVVGGLIGNQVGSGRGNTAATVIGAVGGAVAGNEVEKRVKSTKDYKVSVRMDNGTFQSFTFDAAPPYAIGEKVKVIDGRLVRS